MNKFIRNRVKDGREIMIVGEMWYVIDEIKRLYISVLRYEFSELFNFFYIDVGILFKFC